MNISNKLNLILFLGLAICLHSCSNDDNSPQALELPDAITIQESDFYPEGIVYNEDEQVFYTGSIRKGKIITIDLNGNQQVFAEDETLIMFAR